MLPWELSIIRFGGCSSAFLLLPDWTDPSGVPCLQPVPSRPIPFKTLAYQWQYDVVPKVVKLPRQFPYSPQHAVSSPYYPRFSSGPDNAALVSTPDDIPNSILFPMEGSSSPPSCFPVSSLLPLTDCLTTTPSQASFPPQLHFPTIIRECVFKWPTQACLLFACHQSFLLKGIGLGDDFDASDRLMNGLSEPLLSAPGVIQRAA